MVEIAARQRHMMLLKKVRNNTPLTAAEMRELKDYETMARTAQKKAVKTTAKKKTTRPAAAGKAEVRAALLAKLQELAGAPGVDSAQAADRLGLTPKAFTALLAKDKEAGRLWRHAKIDALVKAGNILWKLADDGNTAAARQIIEGLRATVGGGLDTTAMSTRAVADLIAEKLSRLDYWYRKCGMPKNVDGTVDLRAFLAWWQRWLIGQHTFDPHRVKLIELEPFLGVARQTINVWLKDGLPRNADKTFSLPAVFAWRLKQLGGRPAERGAVANPLQEEKAKKLRLEIDKARAELVDRKAVELGLAARAAVLVALMDRKGAELPTLLANMTAEQISPVLEDCFDALRGAAATVPEDIAAVVPPSKRQALAAFLASLTETASDG